MKTAPLGELGRVPDDLPRTPVPVVAWPEGREPDFVAWMSHARDRLFSHDGGLAAWVRHRLVQPEPNVVYLLRLASGAFYVGITPERRLDVRVTEHQRSARRLMLERPGGELRAYPMAPSEAYVMRHGWDRVEMTALVPDRICAWLLEVIWTCVLARAGVEVFGNDLGDLCPGAAWRGSLPMWDRNTVHAA